MIQKKSILTNPNLNHMNIRKSIIIFVTLSIIPVLQGFDNNASSIYRNLLFHNGSPVFYSQLFNLVSFLAMSLGVLIGGVAIDKWNVKRFILVDLICLSIFSFVLQFSDSYPIILVQRFILAFSFGSLLISFKVFLTEVLESKNRGKLLFAFLNISIIGTLGYQLWLNYFEIDILNLSISYAQLQIPFIALPLLVLLVFKYLSGPKKLEVNKSMSIKYLFRPKQRILVTIMIAMAILLSFANSQLVSLMNIQVLAGYNNEYMLAIPTLSWFVAIVLGVLSIDYFGRTNLINFGIVALIICSVFNIITSFALSSSAISLVLLSLYNFIVLYAISTTTVVVVLEYLPRPVRGRGMILFTLFCWLPNTINNGVIYPFIKQSSYQVAIVSAISLTALLIGWYLLRKRLIETKGLSLNDIKNKIEIE
ncbi:sugar porter family MFS transporter [Labilibacter sediminis]|nr:sugar porter family MFS transporter [Labilibacter sediminis]